MCVCVFANQTDEEDSDPVGGNGGWFVCILLVRCNDGLRVRSHLSVVVVARCRGCATARGQGVIMF